MTTELTAYQRRRIVETVEETKVFLAKEIGYSADLRKLDTIAFYEAHIVKLNKALATNKMPEMLTSVSTNRPSKVKWAVNRFS